MWKRIGAAALVAIVTMQPAAATVPIPCVGAAVEKAPAAMSAADTAFRTLWRDASPNWFTAYEARPPKRNIFDKSPEPEIPLETVKGVAWAHGLYCLTNLSPDGGEVLVRFFARVAAFHEGQSWSQPFENGLLQAYLVKRTGDTWRADPVAGERTIMLPNTVKTRPELAAIPATDEKSGLPCRSGTAWDGKACIAVIVTAKKTR